MPHKDSSVTPNQPRTPVRTLRVPDELWSNAQKVAKDRGESLSDVMRDALEAYVRRYSRSR